MASLGLARSSGFGALPRGKKRGENAYLANRPTTPSQPLLNAPLPPFPHRTTQVAGRSVVWIPAAGQDVGHITFLCFIYFWFAYSLLLEKNNTCRYNYLRAGGNLDIATVADNLAWAYVHVDALFLESLAPCAA